MDMGSRNSMGKSIVRSSMSGTELDRLLLSLVSARFTCGAEPLSFGLTMLELAWLRCPMLVWAEFGSVGFISDDMEELGGGREGGATDKGAKRLS